MNIISFDSGSILYHYVLMKVVNKFSYTELKFAWRMSDIHVIKNICFDILQASRLYVIIYCSLQQSQKYIICVRDSQVTDLENYPLFVVIPSSLVTTHQLFYVSCVVCPSTLKQKTVWISESPVSFHLQIHKYRSFVRPWLPYLEMYCTNDLMFESR